MNEDARLSPMSRRTNCPMEPESPLRGPAPQRQTRRHRRGYPSSISSISCRARGEDAARFPHSLQEHFQAALGRVSLLQRHQHWTLPISPDVVEHAFGVLHGVPPRLLESSTVPGPQVQPVSVASPSEREGLKESTAVPQAPGRGQPRLAGPPASG
eukprot:1978479-Pyramimonas_sp.AAC.1